MLVTLNEVLNKARVEHYAVPAFDCTEDVMIRPILDACEEMRSPVILMALEHDLKGRGFDYITSIIRGVAPQYDIPIVLHLDHAVEYSLIEQAIHYGFTSVMYDGSMLPFEQNVENTKKIVKLAHTHGVATEAELGHVAGNELDGSSAGEMMLTNSEEVHKFVEETGVDALAVSIGTAHGVYVSTPKLNIQRLEQINKISSVPLVLHGGSGTPEDQLKEAIKNGISKLNIYADLRIAMYCGVKMASGQQPRIDPLPDQLFKPVKEQIRQVVVDKINMCMSANRV
jgi:ketose-bisphosphate aldolase